MHATEGTASDPRKRIPLTITLQPELYHFIEDCAALQGACASIDEFFDFAVNLFRAHAEDLRAFIASKDHGGPEHDPPAAFARFISLWRPSGSNVLEDERRIAEMVLLVFPNLHEYTTIHRLLWVNRMFAQSMRGDGARAISETSGCVITCDPEFPDAIRAEWPRWSPPRLPEPLITAIQGSPERSFAGLRITVTASAAYGVLFLQTSVRKPALLTAKQRRVAELLVKGLRTKEIARELGLTHSTVRTYRKTVYRLLGVEQLSEIAEALRENAPG